MTIKDYSFVTKQDYANVAGTDWPSYAQFMLGTDVPESVYAAVDRQLFPPQQFRPVAFCVLPFYAAEYPGNTPCCLIKPNSNLEQIKLQMLQEIRPTACEKCWELEDQGLLSNRKIKNASTDWYLDRNLEDLIEDCRQGNHSVVHYEIDTSNTCNATCVTCGSEASSAWAALERKNQHPSEKHWKISSSQTDAWINFDTAVSISFRGGEPLLSKTNFQILNKLLEHNNTNCFISFVTNGSVTLSTYQKNIISRFKNVNFCLSIDGIGPVFEYLRYPLKWDQLLKNIEFCKNNSIMLSVSYTLSNLNIFYHDQTVTWFDQQNLKYLINTVHDPKFFQPSALPIKLKNIIAQKNPSVAHMIDSHSDLDQQHYQQFRSEIAKQDRWKNINIKDFLPEFSSYLDQF